MNFRALSRHIAPRAMAGAAIEAASAATGAGALLGACVEVAASVGVDHAINRLYGAPRLTVGGSPISGIPAGESRFLGHKDEIRVFHMKHRHFELYERDGLRSIKARIDGGADALDVEDMADTVHVADVSSVGQIVYKHRGYNVPKTAWKGSKMSGSESCPRARQAWQTYVLARLRNEPAYDLVVRKDLSYRRLTIPRTNEVGKVDQVIVAAIREP